VGHHRHAANNRDRKQIGQMVIAIQSAAGREVE